MGVKKWEVLTEESQKQQNQFLFYYPNYCLAKKLRVYQYMYLSQKRKYTYWLKVSPQLLGLILFIPSACTKNHFYINWRRNYYSLDCLNGTLYLFILCDFYTRWLLLSIGRCIQWFVLNPTITANILQLQMKISTSL